MASQLASYAWDTILIRERSCTGKKLNLTNWIVHSYMIGKIIGENF